MIQTHKLCDQLVSGNNLYPTRKSFLEGIKYWGGTLGGNPPM
jgi:hypothetical protein